MSLRLGPAEFLAGLLPRPKRNRQRLSTELLSPFTTGRNILELGRGTGRMARRFVDAGCGSYLATDHSVVAIEAARKRYRRPAEIEKMRFEVRAAHQIPQLGDEIIVSLGVLDWLPFLGPKNFLMCSAVPEGPTCDPPFAL